MPLIPEMTLPTGVSDFLLDCLDEDSTMDSGTESSDRADSYSSPEMFRDESGVGMQYYSVLDMGALGNRVMKDEN